MALESTSSPFATSRQFISRQGLKLKCIPFAGPTTCDLEDSLLEHKLFAVGQWNEEIQVLRGL